MKIRLIYPKFRKFLEDQPLLSKTLEKHVVGEYTMPPSLALPILAALVPSDVEVTITDDNANMPIDYDEKTDLVCISCFTPQAQRAYEIADEFRRRGTKVAIGGIHPSALPEEAKKHADTVCVGEGEPVWKNLLNDAKNNCLKNFYKSDEVYDLKNFPIPDRDIFPRDIYKWNAHLVLTMRGCPVKCIGCPIPDKEGYKMRYRPIDNVIDDIKQMPYNEFYITDDTIMLPGKKNMKYTLKLMEKTKDLDINIFLSATMMMINEPSFYKKLKAGGVSSMYTIFGFDKISQNLFSEECTKDEWQYCVDLVKMNEDNDIHFFGSFGIGFDNQDKRVIDKILKFTDDANISLAEFYIITPFPGTPFGRQAEEEGRILHRNYSSWNHGNVVFKPKNWTEKELLDDYYRLWKNFYINKDPKATLSSFDVNNITT